MKRYPAEYKEWVVEQMMPPINRSVVELARETGVTTVSLRTWRNEAREQGRVVPGNGKQSDKWSSADKFRVVLETASLSEAELSEYCRRKGNRPTVSVLDEEVTFRRRSSGSAQPWPMAAVR